MKKRLGLAVQRFWARIIRETRGTPSIETVLIIALVALAVAPMLDDLSNTLGGILTVLGDTLEDAISASPGTGR